jgi:hemoglobin
LKTDISSRKDIKVIITNFYDLLLIDEKMIPFFEKIIKENQLEHHLEIITDFWEDILFDGNRYQQNVMQKHLYTNTFVTFKKEHFTIWLSYFSNTIDALFEGENSERMKARAQSIGTIMQLKMNLYRK